VAKKVARKPLLLPLLLTPRNNYGMAPEGGSPDSPVLWLSQTNSAPRLIVTSTFKNLKHGAESGSFPKGPTWQSIPSLIRTPKARSHNAYLALLRMAIHRPDTGSQGDGV
jgi:hypothetical protein